MADAKNEQLRRYAAELRRRILYSIYMAKSGHPGGSLSAADILVSLYFEEMNVNPDNPRDDARDRFIMSKGHAAPALYGVLSMKGYFPKEDLGKLRMTGEYLQGHPDMKHTPGVDMSTGSLGQGVSAAVGMALAGKMDGRTYRVYTILGDGELQEGQVWEAAMFAGNRHLDNLLWIVDANGLQIDGTVDEVCSLEPLRGKFEAFHFHVIEADGHDFAELLHAYAEARKIKGQPSVVIARTVKGKGVSFMENQVSWHGKAPDATQYHAAMEELGKAGAAL